MGYCYVKGQRNKNNEYYDSRYGSLYFPSGSEQPFVCLLWILGSCLFDLLRERFDDIPLLVDFFLGTVAKELNKKKPTPPPELWALLRTFQYSGNIRELRNMVYYAMSRHKRGVLSLSGFREYARREADGDFSTSENTGMGLKSLNRLPTLKESARMLIAEALRRTNGNQRMAAGILGITPQSLSGRLKTAGMRKTHRTSFPR